MKHVTQYLAASLLFVTLAACGAMGADAVMPWGMFLGAPEMANEPDLIPLGLAGAVQ